MTDIPAGPRFPEQELEALAGDHERQAAFWRGGKSEGGKRIGDKHAATAKTIRDAMQAHTDMRERLLGQIAELRGQLGQRSAA